MDGTVAETKFQIQCRDWQCPDLPLKYEFTTKTKKESSSVSVSSLSRIDYPIWYTGQEPISPKSILPLGDPTDGYNLTMIIRVINAYGSFTELSAIAVKVMRILNSYANRAGILISILTQVWLHASCRRITTRAVQQRTINRYSIISFSIQSADSLTDYSGGVKLVD